MLANILCQCSIDRTIISITEIEEQSLVVYQNLEKGHKSHIAGKNEPGEKLLLCLTFVNKSDKNELPGQIVHFYHASSIGNYEPTNMDDESTARLNGTAVTDEQGRIYIETILPGDYGSSSDNRHIHTTVVKAKPEAYDIHFKQYTTVMGKRFSKGSDQHFLADLKMTDEGHLVAFLTIEVKNPKNIP